MSSSILTESDQPSAAPVFWRTVTSPEGGLGRARGKNDSEREAASHLEQVRQEAFAEGVAAGREGAEQEIRPAVTGIARSISELSRMREVIREEATQDLVHLAISIAARVIHRDVTIDPDALAGLVKAAFLKAQSREIQRVHVHPALEPMVRKCLEQCGSPKNLMLAVDSGLNAGEIFFETSQGALDASVGTQLQEIERGLIDRLER